MRPPSNALARLARQLLRGYVRYAPAAAGKAYLAGRLLGRYRSVPENQVVRTRSGHRFVLVTDDLLQGYLYLFGVWEPHLSDWVRRTLRPGDTFIDVGAYIGYYTVLAARVVGEGGQVVAIDAAPEYAATVEANLRLNGCANVRVVTSAVSDGTYPLPFYRPHQFNRGHTTSVPHRPASTPLFTTGSRPLPDLLTDTELRRARLLKVDVEGAEYAAVRGLAPALARMRADVELVVEINPDLLAQQGHSAAELVDLLLGYGFHAYRIPNDYCVSGYVPRRPPVPPRRWRWPVTELGDYVFSRRDLETLP
jgi:FkbM family methyltransferase